MFLCVHRNYLLPKDDEGAIFLLGDALIMYLFSLIITHIFYKIPYNHGLLLKLGRDSSEDRLKVQYTTFHKHRDSKQQGLLLTPEDAQKEEEEEGESQGKTRAKSSN
jgi:hypothetical protein